MRERLEIFSLHLTTVDWVKTAFEVVPVRTGDYDCVRFLTKANYGPVVRHPELRARPFGVEVAKAQEAERGPAILYLSFIVKALSAYGGNTAGVLHREHVDCALV